MQNIKQNISLGNIFRIALPIIISGFSTAILQITDTAFLGRVSETSIGAVGNAGLLYFVLIHLGMGLGTGTQIIIGRRNGEGKLNKIGPLVHHTWYILIPLSVLFFILIKYYSETFFSTIIHSENILNISVNFMQYRAYGLFFVFVNTAFMAFYIGITNTKILSISTPITVLINIILDYALIFGNWGMPEMGVKGAAIASVIAEGFSTIIFFTYTLFFVNIKRYKLFTFKIDSLSPYILFRILKTGWPIMAQSFISLASWYAFFSIVEHLGERALAVSHIIRSIYMFAMIPIFGLAVCTNTLTSNLIGQNETQNILKLINKTVLLSFIWNVVMLFLNTTFTIQILSFFTNNKELVDASINTLYIITASMFLFSFAMMHFNAITGTGKTTHSLIIEAISITVYLLFTYYFVEILRTSVEIAWSAEFVYFTVFGIISAWYIRRKKWKTEKL